jgi:C-terminal processing protease CtpA/Prc
MKHYIFLISLFLVLRTSYAQFIPKEEATAEVQFLAEQIKTYNPGLYLFNPDFDAYSNRVIRASISDSLDLFTHFRNISRLCALSNEGHFSLGNWQDTVHAGFAANAYAYLPLSIVVLDSHMYVWKDYSNERLFKQGDEIVAINGMDALDVLNALRKVIPTDGHITSYTDLRIQESFAWIYYLYIGQPQTFEIEATRNSETITGKVQALLRAQQVKNYTAYYPKAETEAVESMSDFYTLTFHDHHALLTLKSFDWRLVQKYELDAKDFYKECFAQLNENGVRNLVIDLRNNTGGRNEFAEELVPYILRDGNEADYLKKSTSWKGKTKTHKMPKPAKGGFNGKIYVLVNGKTYSAAGAMARYLREFADATIIGEETGTRYEGFVAGSQQMVTLPHTRIKIGIPRYVTMFPPSQKQKTSNRGVLPDHEITSTLQDLMEENDPAYELARKLIVEHAGQ